MRLAYADPPYIGQAKRHYNCAEVDHHELLERLVADFPDGWALSCSSPSLRKLLPMCPSDIRVAAWIKPFASFKPGVNPAYAWEPVIFRGGRRYTRKDRTVRDWHSDSITLRKGLSGAKPAGFSGWVFSLLNAQKGDDLVDLFPGTGAVTREWDRLNRFWEAFP